MKRVVKTAVFAERCGRATDPPNEESMMRIDWMRRICVLGATFVLLTQLGCAFGEFRPDDPFSRQYSLEKAQKRYSDLVRWSKFNEAAGFVAIEDRAAFEAGMPDFREVRFTEHETSPWKLDEEMREAVIEVKYRGYSMRSPLEIEVSEVQTWTREGKGNAWTVVSKFEGLDRFALK